MKFLFIIFLLPLQLFAQDISGVWVGTLYNDTTKQYIPYELAINEYNGKLSGYSHTIFIIDSIKNIGVKTVKIRKKKDEFFVEDETNPKSVMAKEEIKTNPVITQPQKEIEKAKSPEKPSVAINEKPEKEKNVAISAEIN